MAASASDVLASLKHTSCLPLIDVTDVDGVQLDTSDGGGDELGSALPSLQRLRIPHSVISSLRDLGTRLRCLAVLDVSHCGLTDLDGISHMPSLAVLVASHNSISGHGLSALAMCDQLRCVDLRHNRLSDAAVVAAMLSGCRLEHLRLEGNPCWVTAASDGKQVAIGAGAAAAPAASAAAAELLGGLVADGTAVDADCRCAEGSASSSSSGGGGAASRKDSTRLASASLCSEAAPSPLASRPTTADGAVAMLASRPETADHDHDDGTDGGIDGALAASSSLSTVTFATALSLSGRATSSGSAGGGGGRSMRHARGTPSSPQAPAAVVSSSLRSARPTTAGGRMSTGSGGGSGLFGRPSSAAGSRVTSTAKLRAYGMAAGSAALAAVIHDADDHDDDDDDADDGDGDVVDDDGASDHGGQLGEEGSAVTAMSGGAASRSSFSLAAARRRLSSAGFDAISAGPSVVSVTASAVSSTGSFITAGGSVASLRSTAASGTASASAPVPRARPSTAAPAGARSRTGTDASIGGESQFAPRTGVATRSSSIGSIDAVEAVPPVAATTATTDGLRAVAAAGGGRLDGVVCVGSPVKALRQRHHARTPSSSSSSSSSSLLLPVGSPTTPSGAGAAIGRSWSLDDGAAADAKQQLAFGGADGTGDVRTAAGRSAAAPVAAASAIASGGRPVEPGVPAAAPAAVAAGSAGAVAAAATAAPVAMADTSTAADFSRPVLVTMLREKPRRVPLLCTRAAFKRFFAGLPREAVWSLLSEAYEGLEASERERKISDRLALLD